MRALHLLLSTKRLLVVAFLLTVSPGISPALAEDAPAHETASEATTEPAETEHNTEAVTPSPGATSTEPEAGVAEPSRELCHDDKDNDGDGQIDCDDLEDCRAFPTCGWILGGWVWIWTIFGVTLGALILYAWLITARLRRARSEGAARNA